MRVLGFRVLGFKIQGLGRKADLQRGLDLEPRAHRAEENCCVTWDYLSWPQGDWERESLYCKEDVVVSLNKGTQH